PVASKRRRPMPLEFCASTRWASWRDATAARPRWAKWRGALTATRVMRRASGVTRVTILAFPALIATMLATGCATELAPREHHEPVPVVDRAAASAAVLNDYMALLQRLIQGAPAEQAEIVATAQKDYETAPTPS